MKTEPAHVPLDKAERARLCASVNLVDVMQADGIAARRSGNTYTASLRPNDKTPSCYIYPPGVGRRGADGWTFYDYGSGEGGDVLGYLVDRRGLPFADALDELRHLAGEPTGNGRAKRPTRGERNPAKVKTYPETPAYSAPPRMAHEEQLDAVACFLLALSELHPETVAKGAAYLSGRGVLAEGLPPMAYHLPADIMPKLRHKLNAAPELDRMKRAGLIKEDGRLQWDTWAGDVVLLVHHNGEGYPAAFIARRTEHQAGDTVGKYLQQTYASGATRLPFGLLTLCRPFGLKWKPTRTRELLVVEGPLDALGAACLGWPALALCMRPRCGGYEDQAGAAPRMLEPYLPTLRDAGRVLVVPDNDQGEKGAEGQALAGQLVGWIRAAGVPAAVATLDELCPNMPAECKDLADVAKHKGSRHE